MQKDWASSGHSSMCVHSGQFRPIARPLGLVVCFEQSKRTTQRVRRCLALVTRHTTDFQLEPQVLGGSLFRSLIQTDHSIRYDWLRDAFYLHMAALLAAHLVLNKCVGF